MHGLARCRGARVRWAVAVLVFVAIPVSAQDAREPAGDIERAMRCVHAAMTDPHLPVGVMPEQVAQATLARCSEEIEAAASACAAGSPSPAAMLDVVRATLRKELYEFALLAADSAHARDPELSDSDSAQTSSREPV